MALRIFSFLLLFYSSLSFADNFRKVYEYKDSSSSFLKNLTNLSSVVDSSKPKRQIIQILDGTFSYANEVNTDVSSSNEDISTDPFFILSVDDIKKSNLKPLYSDSIIKRYAEGILVEQKDLSNGMSMLHFLDLDVGAGYVTFKDLDSDDPNEVKWSVACNVDKITDAKTCSIVSTNKSVVYVRNSDKPSFLIVGSKSIDVLRATYLRVDKNTPFKVNRLAFYRPNLDKILKEMTSGKMMYFRYHREYSASTYDDEISLKGFSFAYNTLNLLYSRLK